MRLDVSVPAPPRSASAVIAGNAVWAPSASCPSGRSPVVPQSRPRRTITRSWEGPMTTTGRGCRRWS